MKRIICFMTVLALLAGGCGKNGADEPTASGQPSDPSNPSGSGTPSVVRQTVYLKLDRKTAESLNVARTRSGYVTISNMSFDELCKTYEIVDVQRVFAPDEFEERMRKADLDLWYYVMLGNRLGSKISAEAAAVDFASLDCVLSASAGHRVRRIDDGKARYASEQELSELMTRHSATRADAALPFDDACLGMQWMLCNDGTVYPGAEAGADINVFDAWKHCTGNPAVIVAVMDGGVECDHPDLAGNIWEGRGCNFFASTDGSAALDIDEHGTHVAGTIAAVSNNGIGIAGIAGGDGTPDSGVKIMSCQVFPSDEEYDEYSDGDIELARAVKFAADHGAVISTNSWGYDGISNDFYYEKNCELMVDAYNYFIEFAGTTPDGSAQAAGSPMKGGIVLFAGGNDGSNRRSYPGSYGAYLSIAAMACNYQAAYYSNYYETIDLLAPGGGGWTSKVDDDMYNAGYIGYNLSTLPTTVSNGDIIYDERGKPYQVDYIHTSGYGWMSGTSMATPHAAGVAALIVSKFGGPGFTADDLKRILLDTARDVDKYQETKRQGKTGRLVDAAAALSH